DAAGQVKDVQAALTEVGTGAAMEVGERLQQSLAVGFVGDEFGRARWGVDWCRIGCATLRGRVPRTSTPSPRQRGSGGENFMSGNLYIIYGVLFFFGS